MYFANFVPSYWDAIVARIVLFHVNVGGTVRSLAQISITYHFVIFNPSVPIAKDVRY